MPAYFDVIVKGWIVRRRQSNAISRFSEAIYQVVDDGTTARRDCQIFWL